MPAPPRRAAVVLPMAVCLTCIPGNPLLRRIRLGLQIIGVAYLLCFLYQEPSPADDSVLDGVLSSYCNDFQPGARPGVPLLVKLKGES
ncbi:hypothetical protein EJB05_42587 [Eragrostis curvula]|uniref:Uncharacterized protein n=1 Tax=Eragrostis curvula TaxID=38414 RepID=A0A5J9TCN0_9POAL|nr:hypothetical protein EJB05_42587 [Eragrostis curvula]